MRVIFVTDSYFPKPSPNALCVSKLKGEFERRRIDVHIVALRTFDRETILVPDNNSVTFVEPNRAYSALIQANTSGDSKKIARLSKLFRLRGAVYGLFWPLMSLRHLNNYVNALRHVLDQSDEETVVIGVYKSLEAALAGAIVKKTYSKAFYILYTLDAVSGSIIPTIYGRRSIAMNSIRRWEKRLFGSYDKIYLMESHRDYYSNVYYDWCREKMRFVDIPLLYKAEKEDNSNTLKGAKRLIYTGYLSRTAANPIYFLDMLDNIGDLNISVDFYGKCSDAEITARIERSPYAEYHGPVPAEMIPQIQNQATALLNFGNDTPCAIPCKIFEYFSTGKPVISMFKIDDDASRPYMSKYSLSLQLDERLPIYENAMKFRHFINDSQQYSQVDAAAIFQANTPGATVDAILEDLKGKR